MNGMVVSPKFGVCEDERRPSVRIGSAQGRENLVCIGQAATHCEHADEMVGDEVVEGGAAPSPPHSKQQLLDSPAQAQVLFAGAFAQERSEELSREGQAFLMHHNYGLECLLTIPQAVSPTRMMHCHCRRMMLLAWGTQRQRQRD